MEAYRLVKQRPEVFVLKTLPIQTIVNDSTQLLTQNIEMFTRRSDFPNPILCLTVVLPGVRGCDGVYGVSLWTDLRVNRRSLLKPGVGECCRWGLVNAGQSHWTALLYFIRGSHWYRDSLWTIWKREKWFAVSCEIKDGRHNLNMAHTIIMYYVS